ncbi:pyruvate dehydrogenase [Paractinoplanes rishiriensis]|uniref:Pyruvate dehydrogenase n=1 Tax=Paractinoplanes rishiriensis TaxID=1050105 RepID=A0A919KC80_9ACTN|nr:pyruvate dehydrogenase [Actinoplanes rishiriensis]GIF00872.1 pyruvate dehydrogenase [Actinoplanes rishiriensis]
MTTVAEQIIDDLYAAGVRHIYGLVGDSLNPITDAIRRHRDFRWIHVHNEEAAAFAASAEAQVTGRLAVCAGSCGPGNTHLIQGLYDAHRSGAPVLALASHIPSSEIGTGYFQETHPERVFIDCSHFCEMVNGAGQMPRVLRIAMQTAVGRGGVAVLALPGDISARPASNPSTPFALTYAKPIETPATEQVQRLAELLTGAEKIMLFVGAGAREARQEVLDLAGAVQAPVGHSLGGKEWIQFDNPYDVGMSGLLGYGACYQAMHDADLVVLLGTDFPYESFLPQRNTVQVDRDPTRLGRRTALELGIAADVGATIRALLPLLTRRSEGKFLARMLHRHAAALEDVVRAHTSKTASMTPISPEYVAAQLDDLADDDAIFTVDTGMCNVWAARYLTPTAGRRVIGSFRHGSMANALPQALGAQIAYPGRQVIAMSGDGGLAMLLGELLTAREQALPVKVVVFNNGSLGMIRLEMMVAGYPYYETDHGTNDYAAIAAACGLDSATVDEPAELGPTLTRMLQVDGPALVDVRTDPNALSIPPKITAEQVRGFALASMRTVLDGGVGRMVELARSNIRNLPRP